MLKTQEFLANPIIKGLITQAQKETPFGLAVMEALQNQDMKTLGFLAKEYNDFMLAQAMKQKDELMDKVWHRLQGEA
jgi:hypothetical protein